MAIEVEDNQQHARFQLAFHQQNLEDGILLVESARTCVLEFAKYARPGLACEVGGELRHIDGILYLRAYYAKVCCPQIPSMKLTGDDYV